MTAGISNLIERGREPPRIHVEYPERRWTLVASVRVVYR
jgi:hypothetical protein